MTDDYCRQTGGGVRLQHVCKMSSAALTFARFCSQELLNIKERETIHPSSEIIYFYSRHTLSHVYAKKKKKNTGRLSGTLSVRIWERAKEEPVR